ncbi:gliding motility-associated-like protein [Filimonas zeae]|uniref:LamG-like jellyroll fold domain-containing protein n=1 Tax=Filimonas zeae TaxID=1737353 RepID=UPI001665524A|nr:LamG-like jellyroll fold domain-containing protein [Filimonas zeae]MDR6340687.1 gliding motility-associated-like protein [Filimonas zeae]
MLLSYLWHRLRCVSLLVCLFIFSAAAVAQTVELQNGLIGYYPFNGNANDASGNNIHGTVSGAQLTTDRFGNANGAYRFNGSTSYIQLPFSQLYNFKPTDAYSLSVWIQHEAGSGPRAMIVKSPYAANFHNSQWNYGIYLSDFDQVHSGYHDNLPVKSTTSLTAGETCWYLVTSTYDNGRWKLYINGKQESEDLSQARKILQDGVSSIVFGRKGEANGDYYKGKLDEVRIYNRALNKEEVAALYTQGTPCVQPIACNSWLYNPEGSSGVRVGDLDVSGTQLTVEALINRTEPYTGTHQYAGNIVAKHTGVTDCNYLLRPNHAELTTSNGFVATPPACDIQLNKTYHVAMVYDGQKLKFYRNGFLMNEVPCTGNIVTNDWITTIGEIPAYPKVPREDFVGYINEVRIWNVARTQDQIKQYMNTSLPNAATQTGLLGYYTFDNLLNKQGNTAWNGALFGRASIAQTNTRCTISKDSCPVANPVVTAAFTAPDTVCVNTPVAVNNLSENASRYYWNFNTANVNRQPEAVNMGNIGGMLNVPVFGDIVEANGNYHVFVVNHNNFQLIRLDFGNSLLNTPTAVPVSVPSSYKNAEGIQVVFNENKWYAFVVGGNPDISGEAYLLKIEFGASVTNTNPTVTNLRNVGAMLFPHDLYMFKDGAAWYGLTVNKDGNSITRINFTESFDNTPTGVNLGSANGVLSDPVGICCIKTNGNWHAFVTEDNNDGGLVRLDFGNSLLNTPTGVELKTNMPLTHLRDVHIMPYCDGITGFIIDGDKNALYQLDFGNDITGTPVVKSYGNTGNLSFPHSLSRFFRVGGELYSFITNARNHTISRVRFFSSDALPSQVSTLDTPPAYTYTTPGTYNINLVVDEGLFTQTAFCKSVVVKDCTPPASAAFAAPDTVCVNTPVNVTDLSVNATKYYWNFNSADVNSQPAAVNLGNIGNRLVQPVFTDVVEANGNYYVFVVNHIPAGITRLDFGNSLLNTPTAVPLNLNGNLPTSAEGIQVVYNENKWYAFVVGGNLVNAPSYLVKMEFGADVTNTAPVVTNLGNVGEMGFPLDLYMFKDGDNWYGLTVNITNKTLVRLNFTSSFNNIPTGVNLGTISGLLSEPTGIFPIKVKDQWHVFAANSTTTQSVVRLDFGSSLLNVPTGTVLTSDIPLSNIRDLYILASCDGFTGFAIDGTSNQLLKLDFGSSITSMPAVTSYGNTGNLSFPHSLSKMFRVGGDLYSFIPNVTNNTITRVRFSSSTVVSGSVSTLAAPPAVTYTTPGKYNINLVINEGLSNQTAFCKSVIVIGRYAQVPVVDTVVCTDSVVLKTRFTTPVTWNNGALADSMIIKADGTYWVHTDNYGCMARDSFIYAFRGLQAVLLGNDTTLCAGQQLLKSFTLSGVSYEWQDGSTANTYTMEREGRYKLTVKNTWCSVQDSMQLTVIPVPEVKLMNDTAICEKDVFTMIPLQLVYADSIRWTPEEGLSNTVTANPLTLPLVTTQYKLTAYNKQCSYADSVLVTVNALPALQLNNDTAVCAGRPVPLQASGADVYEWEPAEGITNTTLAGQQVTPAADVRYYIKGTNTHGCFVKDSVLVQVVPMPQVKLMNDTAYCRRSSLMVRAENMQYTDSVRWVPATGLSAANVATPFASPDVTTSYTVSVYNRFCKAEDAITLTIKEIPEVLVSADTAICQGDSLRLAVTGGAVAYQWRGGADIREATSATPLVQPLTGTRYYVTATGVNACTADDSVWVEVNPPAVLALFPEKTAVCNGDSLTLHVSGNAAHRWLVPGQEANTATAITFLPTLPGGYAVEMHDAGCNRTDTLYSLVTLNDKPLLAVSRSNDIDCIYGESKLTVTGGSTYQWYPTATLSAPYSYNPVARTDTSTWYHVFATGFNGCISEDSVLVRVLKNNFNAYPIATGFTPNGDGKNDCFRINKWGLIKSMQMVIYNRWGERVFVTSNPDDCWDGRYKGEAQPPGTFVYTIKATTLCGTVTRNGTVVLVR